MTEGGCFLRSTSTGSLEAKHMMCSAHSGRLQHSESEQSVMPSSKVYPLSSDSQYVFLDRFKFIWSYVCAYFICKREAPTFIVILVVVAREFKCDGAISASPAVGAGTPVHSIFQKTLSMTSTAIWTTSCVH